MLETTKDLCDRIASAFFSYVKTQGKGREPLTRAEFDENIESLGFLISSLSHGGYPPPSSLVDELFTEPFTLKKSKLLLLGCPTGVPLAEYFAHLVAWTLHFRGHLKKGVSVNNLRTGLRSPFKHVCLGEAWSSYAEGAAEHTMRNEFPKVYPKVFSSMEAHAREWQTEFFK